MRFENPKQYTAKIGLKRLHAFLHSYYEEQPLRAFAFAFERGEQKQRKNSKY